MLTSVSTVIGFIVTYVAPLAFVLTVTMGKEAYDDYKRHLRDTEANSQRYLVLDRSLSSVTSPTSLSHLESQSSSGIPITRATPSSKLRVGDLVFLEKNQRVPADLVLLRTSDSDGTCFIRTDQLDGETDWKLRVAVPSCQKLGSDRELLDVDAEIYADAPMKDINTFIGTFSLNNPPHPPSTSDQIPLVPKVEPLTVENVLWSNTVLAAGTAVGFVIYTGEETRAVMNTSHPETKVGLLDLEINRLAKVTLVLNIFGFNHDLYLCDTDPLCRHLCFIVCLSCSEWFQRSVVCLRVQVLDSFLVYHPNQVRPALIRSTSPRFDINHWFCLLSNSIQVFVSTLTWVKLSMHNKSCLTQKSRTRSLEHRLCRKNLGE